MDLVLFDFDKTLTTKDSFIEFLKFAVPKKQLIIKGISLLPLYLCFKLSIYPSEKFKKKVLKSFFYNKSQEQMHLLGLQFSNKIIPQLLNKKLITKLNKYISNGDKVVLVSASLSIWLKPWTENKGIDLICTQLYFENSLFKGAFNGKNCNRAEKKTQVIRQYDLKSFTNIICYGNRGGDDELLSLASSIQYKNII